MSKYEEGDILKPVNFVTGYAQIYKVQIIPDHRLGYYSSDNSVKELYHVYTDFGNTFVFTEKEVTEEFVVMRNEPVYERMLVWKDRVCKVVDDYEKMVVWGE